MALRQCVHGDDVPSGPGGRSGRVGSRGGTDTEAGELADRFERQRLADARRIVEQLVALDALGGDLKRAEATDLAWLSTDPRLYDRLMRVRGWTHRRFEKWLAKSLCRQLLGG